MILFGKPVADYKKQEIAKEVSFFRTKNMVPTLAIVQLTNDDSLEIYLGSRQRIAKEIGIEIIPYKFINPTYDEVECLIESLNNDDGIWGIMIDNPIPSYLDFDKLTLLINPSKDVEGFNHNNSIIVPVAKAVFEVMKYYNIDYKNNSISVIGDSKNVGHPISQLLIQNGCKVDVFSDPKIDIDIETKTNPIVIVAANSIEHFKKENFLKNSIVFDIGTHYKNDGTLCGDVDVDVQNYVNSICPSPKGVGPVTSVMLFDNLLRLKDGKL